MSAFPVKCADESSKFSLYPTTVQLEVDLVRSIFGEPNKVFEQDIHELRSKLLKDRPGVVQFHEIGFVFHHPLSVSNV